VWVPNIVSQGLIWGFAVFDGPTPAGSWDGSAAVVLDRLTRIRLDCAARPIAGVQGCRDIGVAASAGCASPPGGRSPAVVGGSGDPFRAGAAPCPMPPMSSVRDTADAPALACRPGEATLDLSQAWAGTATDPPRIRTGVIGASPGRSRAWAGRCPRPPCGRSCRGPASIQRPGAAVRPGLSSLRLRRPGFWPATSSASRRSCLPGCTASLWSSMPRGGSMCWGSRRTRPLAGSPSKPAAPRSAVLYPSYSEERLEEMSLDLMADLNQKGDKEK
jgi:hypothetical protein